MLFKAVISVLLIFSFYLVLFAQLISRFWGNGRAISSSLRRKSIKVAQFKGGSGGVSKAASSYNNQSLDNKPPSPKSDVPSIILLAKQISELSTQLSSCFNASTYPEPNFSASSGDVPKTPQYESLRASLNDSALDLLRLVNGPKNTLRTYAFSHYDLAVLQIAVERGFFGHIPLHGSIDAGMLADKAKMDENRTTRLLRLLATRRIFEEVGSGSGVFRHTAMSAVMARDSNFHAMVHMQMDEMFKAAAELSTQIDRSPYVSDNENSAFYAKFGLPAYEYYEQNPQKGARFAQSMNAWSQLDSQVTRLVHSSFPWESLKVGKVVDIGGGSGHISIALAREYPSLRFIVQDLSEQMLSQVKEESVSSTGGRVTFQRHNFFEPQPVHDAIKITRAIVPALEKCAPGTPLLLNEVILPESGSVSRHIEHHLRQVDVTMMVVLGAKQRSRREFEKLLKQADPRYEVVRTFDNPMGVGLLEVHLKAR
ncbi:Winged helix-turn-helix transcription repressor DNA-binding [Penicillium griseofulvum]|uniref:Winged helix-turn-helix transcription repressor DNA-binding n=1 Tax=Penicillium patulum TaxID=5078 RepID=A0A135LMR7_PENPA|nr:Winged helix-turn-helix transcription repressor DNA-binding [Penicillium griseofulvum]KXG50244.1 Winged helix-turn-helix transcription repressor DNA-binding [Penicillium griseofulvum]